MATATGESPTAERRTPTRGQIMKLAGEALMDERTIRKAYAGHHLRGLALERLEAACEKLGIPKP